MSSSNMQAPRKSSGLGIIIVIILALVIIGIVLGMRGPKVPPQTTDNTSNPNQDLYGNVDSLDQNLNSVQFEGSADTL